MKKLKEIAGLPFTGVFISILFFTSFSQAFSSPQYAPKSPHYWCDVNFFRIDSNISSIEVYYSIVLRELEFNIKDGEYLAGYAFSVDVKDTSGQSVYRKTRNRTVRAASVDEIRDEKRGVVDQFTFSLPAGKYLLKTSLKDASSGAVSADSMMIDVPAFGDELCVSSVQLASFISPAGEGSREFVKGGRVVTPNPSGRYRYQKAILYLYFEVYGLVSPDTLDNQFLTEYVITDGSGDSLLVIPAKASPKPGTSSVKMQALDIRGLDEGSYYLYVKAIDPASGESASAMNSFWIRAPRQKQVVAAPRLPMTKKDIQKYRDQIKYLATREELRIFDQLTPEGKETFLINFWRSKDPTPETPENEFMMDYFARINYANKNFKGRNGGMNSDMGRIFIIYGQPDDIERHEFSLDTKPYVIWHYYIAGRKHYFVFVDRNSEGIYTLVHSDVEGEIRNENWMEQELR